MGPIQPSLFVDSAVLLLRQPPRHSRRPQTAGSRALKLDSIPIGAASAANASGLVQTPQSKVPGPNLSTPPEVHAPGHFRLSHSVSRSESAKALTTIADSAMWRFAPSANHPEELSTRRFNRRSEGAELALDDVPLGNQSRECKYKFTLHGVDQERQHVISFQQVVSWRS
jgi:hypothetical protein